MTPAARLAAAAGILDELAAGAPAEKVLTTWARRNRFAGSKDRAAIRDIVYEILRKRHSCAALGGGTSGRALCLGLLRSRGEAPDELFTGVGYAMPPLSEAERAGGREPTEAEARDLPDWLVPKFQASLGQDCEAVCQALRQRAPVDLRVNLARTDRQRARASLLEDGIATVELSHADTALRVVEGARRVSRSTAYSTGLVEIQDAGSQAVCAAIPLEPGMRVLDFCAGGGGKALALADRGARVVAHDADPRRMADLPPRAARAGVAIDCVGTGDLPEHGAFDVVVADVPCSGSGAWRRQVEEKWRLTASDLERLTEMQARIASEAARFTAPGGLLAYVTCSVLTEENEAQVDFFISHSNGLWREVRRLRTSLLDGSDGFFLAVLRKTRDRRT